MKKVITFEDIYLVSKSAIAGPVEGRGPGGSLFDEVYDDLYFGQSNFEQAEIYMQKEVISKTLFKNNLTSSDIAICFGGDLINQVVISNFAMRNFEIPFAGLYGACSTSALGLIMASIYLSHTKENYALALTSSHNATSERQFRSPNEYGGAKTKSSNFTVTAATCFLVSRKKGLIKITKALVGEVIDMGQNNMFDMGRAMAPAAAESILGFLIKTNTTPKDYDLILTGDLSTYGSAIVKTILDEHFNYSLNYQDCGLMIFKDDEKVFAGGSGAACSSAVLSTLIWDLFSKRKLDKVLFCATGALMNNMTSLQKETIPAICHVVLLEREK